MEKNKYSILVIDDESFIREPIVEMLTYYGYTAVPAANGNEAISLLKKTYFDLVLCDISMPGQTGFEVFQEVKTFTPDVKFVFVSAFDNKENIQKGMEMGAKAFIGKPFDTDELLDAIENILKH